MIDYTAVLATPARLYQVKGDEEQLEALAKEESKGCDGQLAVGILRGKHYPAISVDQEALSEARGLSEQMRELFELPMLEVASRYDHQQWLEAMARFIQNWFLCAA
ncbi:HrpA-like helicase [Vibrio ponticus]|nr:HrpA-like helicase [Vibrio ponticus]